MSYIELDATKVNFKCVFMSWQVSTMSIEEGVVVWMRNAPHKFRYLNTWSPVGDTVWGGYVTFQMLGHAGESTSLGAGWTLGIKALSHFQAAFSSSCVKRCDQTAFPTCCNAFSCHYWLFLWNHVPNSSFWELFLVMEFYGRNKDIARTKG